MKDEQGTTKEQDKRRIRSTFKAMWPKPWAKGIDKETRIGDFGHALSNCITESVRRNAQESWKFLVVCIIVLLIMLMLSEAGM